MPDFVAIIEAPRKELGLFAQIAGWGCFDYQFICLLQIWRTVQVTSDL